jgi:hypothetical protein
MAMIRNIFLTSVLFALLASYAWAAAPAVSEANNAANKDDLYDTISKLDAAFFDAFNHCSSPGELDKHANYLNENVEFYHDKGGVSWTRKDYIDKTRANVCGNFRRVLTAGSLQVFPIKDYGAIEEGHQTFCDIKSDKCFGEAKFLIVWHRSSKGWEITRILSYGHHAID